MKFLNQIWPKATLIVTLHIHHACRRKRRKGSKRRKRLRRSRRDGLAELPAAGWVEHRSEEAREQDPGSLAETIRIASAEARVFSHGLIMIA